MPEGKRYRGTTGLFPQPMGNVLNAVTAPVIRKHGSLKARIFSYWPEIVGTEIAAKCRPKDLSFPPQRKDKGKLTLLVQPGFALELQHSEPLILEKLAVYIGYRAIETIRLVHA